MPTPPKGAKWTESPKVVTRLNYRSDRVGYTDEAYRHIFVIPADGGTARQITNGEWNHSAPSWSADSKSIAFSSLREPDAEAKFRQSNIYAVSLATGEIKQLIASRRHERQSRVLARRPLHRLHVRGLRRPLGVGGDEALGHERRRLERALRQWHPRSSDLGRHLGRGQHGHLLQRGARGVEGSLLRHDHGPVPPDHGGQARAHGERRGQDRARGRRSTARPRSPTTS